MRKKYLMMLITAIIIVMSFATFNNCGKSKNKTAENNTENNTENVKSEDKNTENEKKEQETLQIKGSDTMVNLVSVLAEEYMKENPNDKISVTGGGSGTGISALLNGTVELANASRKIKDKELDKAAERGMSIIEHVVGVDGLAIITNSKNPVNELTVNQVGQIFKGDISNWKTIGGNDVEIKMHGRQPNSGTFAFLRKHVVKADYSPKVSQQNGNSAIVQNVKLDENSIGYVGAGYLKEAGEEIKAIKIKADKNQDGYSPADAESVYADKYPITRNLYIYSNGEPEGITKRFIDYCKSEAGQKIVEDMGFYSSTK